jgi:hypothetical protein
MTSVRANTSVARLRRGTTLCDGARPQAQVDFFQRFCF